MSREPVIARTSIAAAVSVVVLVLGMFGVSVPGDVAGAFTDAVALLLTVGSWAWAAFSARARVTPVAPTTEPTP